MGFKTFLKESGRDVSKKFKIYTDDSLEKYQEVDIETVRNIIVNKLATDLNEKPNLAHKTREEIEDSIRLREIKQSMGDLFLFKYSIFNRPLIPGSERVDYEDWQNYEEEKVDFLDKDESEEGSEENQDVTSDTADSYTGDMGQTEPNFTDTVSHDFGVDR
jgi:hypothetical protein